MRMYSVALELQQKLHVMSLSQPMLSETSSNSISFQIVPTPTPERASTQPAKPNPKLFAPGDLKTRPSSHGEFTFGM